MNHGPEVAKVEGGYACDRRRGLGCGLRCGFFVVPRSRTGGAPVSLQEQLAAQYKLVKMGSDSSGPSVITPGTVLAIQKGGILGVPCSDTSVLATKYEGGTVHTPSTILSKGIGLGMGHFGKTQTTHLFQVGDKVYVSKMEVNVGKDAVALNIVACDSCNKTDPPTYNKAQVVFLFPKGTLATASAGDVEDTIGQLLSISDDTQQDQGAQQGGQAAQGGRISSHSSSNNRLNRRRSRKDRPPIRWKRLWVSRTKS